MSMQCAARTQCRRRNRPDTAKFCAHFLIRTGIPVVLNTSFNRHGFPMVATPRQAIQLLLEGCVDVLAIEGCLVERPAGPITDPV